MLSTRNCLYLIDDIHDGPEKDGFLDGRGCLRAVIHRIQSKDVGKIQSAQAVTQDVYVCQGLHITIM